MKRIAILHHALGRFGGAEKMSIQHALHLDRLDFDVELFYGGPIHKDWKIKAESKIKFHDLPFGISLSYKNYKEIYRLIRYLNKFDIVMFHHHIDPFMAYYLSIFVKTKKVWYCGEPLRAIWEDKISGIDYRELKTTVIKTSNESFGGILSRIFLSGPLYDVSIKIIRYIDIKTVYSFDYIIANSKYTKEVVKKIYGIYNNVSVVYPGTEIRKFIESRKLSNMILCIGAFIPMKNHINLLSAFSLLPDDIKSSYRLLLVGDGALRKDIETHKNILNLDGQIIIKPYVDEIELEQLYAQCRFAVHIALYEPFGLIPIEASMFGKPSIVSNIGGTKESVTNGDTGLVVNPYDVKEISKAMLSLIKNDRLTDQMGYNMRERSTYFDIEKSTENLAGILGKIK